MRLTAKLERSLQRLPHKLHTPQAETQRLLIYN